MKYISKAVRFMINLLLTAIFFVPLYWMALTAFKTAAQALQSPPTFWVSDPQWENFARAIEVIPFFHFLKNFLSIGFVRSVILNATTLISYHVLFCLSTTFLLSAVRSCHVLRSA